MTNDEYNIMARIGGMDKTQIIAFLQHKGYTPTKRWDELWQAAHNHAKTIAGETKLDVLADVFNPIENNLKTGATRKKTAIQIAESLAKNGWYFGARGASKQIDYKGVLGALLPLSDEDKQAPEAQLMKGSVRRLKLIVRQNTQTAYMAGAYQTQVENIKYRLYWRYIGINDQSIRESHRVLHHKIYRANDPVWDIIYPPNGFNCRCKVSALSERDMKRRGFSVDSATVDRELINKDKHGNDRYRYKITTGEASEYIDESFGYNAGKEMLRTERLFNKLDKLPEAMKPIVKRDLLNLPNTQVNSPNFLARYARLEGQVNRALKKGKKPLVIRKELASHILWQVAVVDESTQQLFKAKTNRVWLSDDTLIKQIISRSGQPIGWKTYTMVDDILNHADEKVTVNDKKMAFFKRAGKWYQAIVKVTEDGQELYLVSFYRVTEQEKNRFVKKRKNTPR